MSTVAVENVENLLRNEDTIKVMQDMLVSYNHVRKWNIEKKKGAQQEEDHGACGFKNCKELTKLYNHRNETKHDQNNWQLIDCSYPNCAVIHVLEFHFKTCYQSACDFCKIPRKAIKEGAHFFCPQNGLNLDKEKMEKKDAEDKVKKEREEGERKLLAQIEETKKVEQKLAQFTELDASQRMVIITLMQKVQTQEQAIVDLKGNQETLQKEIEQYKKEHDYGVKHYEHIAIEDLRQENKRQAEKIEELKMELEMVSKMEVKEEVKQEEILKPDFSQCNFNVMEQRTGPKMTSEVQEEKNDETKEEKTLPNFEWGFFGMLTDDMKQLRAENAELKEKLKKIALEIAEEKKTEEHEERNPDELEKLKTEDAEEAEEDEEDSQDDSDDSDESSDDDSDSDDDGSDEVKNDNIVKNVTQTSAEEKPEDQLVICHVIDILIGFVLLFGLYSLIVFFIERFTA